MSHWLNRTVAASCAAGVALALGCGTETAPTQDRDATPADAAPAEAEVGVHDDEVVLGTHADLTGPVSIWGNGMVNGAQMRFKEANDAGGVHGRRIRFVVEDSQYQIQRAITAANKLINRDRIFAMVGAVGTQTNVAVMASPDAADVPNLFPGSGARAMVEPFKKHVFTHMGLYYEEIRAGVKHFVQDLGKKKPCVIYHDTEYGMEILEGAQDQAAQMGIEIVETAAHKPTDVEFTSSVLRLRKAGCDLVMVGLVHRDTILVLETAKKKGWQDVAWVGNEAAYGRVIADQPSGSGEGYYAFVPIALLYEDDPLSPPVRAWFDAYKASYGEVPSLPAMVGYRAADLTVRGLEIAGRDLTRAKMIAALESLSEYTDLFGHKLTFGPQDHRGVDSSTLSQVQNGRWVQLDTVITY